VPEYVVRVEEHVGAEDDALSERLLRELPTDDVGAGIRGMVVPGGA
jgi:hypothetical protein